MVTAPELDRRGLRYRAEVADGVSSASRAALEQRGLRYFVPVLVDASSASRASLERQGLCYAVQVDADIAQADRDALERQGLRYFVEVDSSGNSVAAVAAPVLSAASAADFSDIFVWGRATTDTASGTLYAVVVPSAATTPTAVQIVAGTDAAGAAAPNANVAVTSTGVKNVLVRGLTAVTAYKVCMTHQAATVNSNVVTGSFTTDTLVVAFATNGLATGMAPSTGCAVFGTNIADPHGGTNAVRFVDTNDAAVNQLVLAQSTVTFFNGVNKVHATVKHSGGAAWLRFAPASTTVVGNAHWNTSTGAIGTLSGAWTPTPVVFDIGSGWKMFSGTASMAGADVAGSFQYYKCGVDNNISSVTRNGTNIQDLYNIRITRV